MDEVVPSSKTEYLNYLRVGPLGYCILNITKVQWKRFSIQGKQIDRNLLATKNWMCVYRRFCSVRAKIR